MSLATLAQSGYTAILSALTDGLVCYAHLYTSDPEITDASVVGDFTEVIYDGYAALAVERWTPPYLRGGIAFSVCDPAIFTFAGGAEPLPVRGYYCTAGRDGPLLWAWRRPDPPTQLSLANPLIIVYVKVEFPPRSE